MNTSTTFSRRKALVAAVSLALGTAMAPQIASAKQYTFNWTGYFIMLDAGGNPMGNTSAAKGVNQYQTPISGTLVYDDTAGTGSMTIGDFNFFSNPASEPAQAQSVTLQYIGNGTSGAGTLMLSNMLFNWNGSNGIPVSAIFDASGIINTSGVLNTLNVSDVVSGVGAIPASDGSYVGGGVPNTNAGYLELGPTPIATTSYNTTFTSGCSHGADGDFTNNTGGGCMGINPSGQLPLIVDTATNNNDYVAPYTGAGNLANAGIGGNPMADGPFINSNATFAVSSLTLVSNGSGPAFTQPTNVNTTANLPATPPPRTVSVNLGTVTNEGAGVVVEYSIDGLTPSNPAKVWVVDDGANNPINVLITQTVNTMSVDWRATDSFNNISLATQTVTVTINDTVAPTFPTFPADFSVSVASTAASITFEGPTSGHGSVTASDTVDPNPAIEWSLDNLNWTPNTPGVDVSSANFASGANTVYWRVTDATGNTLTRQQTVTVILPTGIVGQPCDVDTELLNATIGTRQLNGTFTMRDSNGNLVGTVDPAVTGTIDSSVVCTDVSCTNSGATLASPTPFYGSLWTTSNITLFNNPATSTTANTYTFETCPSDGSSLCTAPDPLSMTVHPGEIGAHMLFDWSINHNIDVVVVWKPSCGAAQLVSTDPDGDGIIGTQMVDGPFKGMNAAFDVRTVLPSRPLTTGGYVVTVPAVNNPIANTSPIAVDPGTVGTDIGGVVITGAELTTWGASADSGVVTSCVGGCFDFSVSGRATGETIQVVLPLSSPIPWYSLYRKYHVGTNSWTSFVTTATDNVKTAPLASGSCPEPGAGDYTAYSNGVLAGMLRPDDQCVQLTITDNGPNDSNPANGVIADPGGVGVTSGPAAPTTATSGGGSLDPWMLGALLAWFGRRRKAQP